MYCKKLKCSPCTARDVAKCTTVEDVSLPQEEPDQVWLAVAVVPHAGPPPPLLVQRSCELFRVCVTGTGTTWQAWNNWHSLVKYLLVATFPLKPRKINGLFSSFWQIVIFLSAKSEAKIIRNLTLFSILSKLSRLLVGHSTRRRCRIGTYTSPYRCCMELFLKELPMLLIFSSYSLCSRKFST